MSDSSFQYVVARCTAPKNSQRAQTSHILGRTRSNQRLTHQTQISLLLPLSDIPLRPSRKNLIFLKNSYIQKIVYSFFPVLAITMEVTLEEKLRVIDDKMKEYELSPELSERVKAHMLKALELSQEKLAVLGPCPQTVPEREAWERNKQEMEESLTIQLESERLIEGLVDPWAMYLSRENLKTLRSRVASGQAGDVPLPQTLQEIGTYIALAPPVLTSMYGCSFSRAT